MPASRLARRQVDSPRLDALGQRKANMFVLTPDLGLGDATAQSPAPPTRPANPEPITRSEAVVNAPASGPDWGSAGIGAAAVIGAVAIVLAGAIGVHRRRAARLRPVTG
jgi:hypothetical protein